MDRCTVRFLFITLFPEQIEQAAGHSIIKRAADAGLVEVSCINPRDFATDRHRTVDDTPFGGGAGMVLKPEPMVAAIRMAKQQLPAARVIAMCPGGRTLKQDIVEEYARSGQDLILVCGNYEGFERVLSLAYWEKWPVPLKTLSVRDCWNILSTPGRWNLKDWKYRKCCVTAITL